MLADAIAGDGRRDRLEVAAVLRGSIRLEVPGVLMRRPAPHEENDARLRLAERLLRVGLARPQQFRQPEPDQRKGSGPEEVATSWRREEHAGGTHSAGTIIYTTLWPAGHPACPFPSTRSRCTCVPVAPRSSITRSARLWVR